MMPTLVQEEWFCDNPREGQVGSRGKGRTSSFKEETYSTCWSYLLYFMIQTNHLLMLGPHQSEEDEKDEEEVVALLLALHPHCQLKKYNSVLCTMRSCFSNIIKRKRVLSKARKLVLPEYPDYDPVFDSLCRNWPDLRHWWSGWSTALFCIPLRFFGGY